MNTQEKELIRWAHLMLQPPSELQLDREHSQRSTLHRLNALRVTALNILGSPGLAETLAKVKSAVEKNIICIRREKQLDADLG